MQSISLLLISIIFCQDFELEKDRAEILNLSSEINWFFFFLFIVGYVEDHKSGLSLRLPGGLLWSVFVEVCYQASLHKIQV